MGRLLDIARTTKTALMPSTPLAAREDRPQKNLPPMPPALAKPPRELPTADVISIIVQARKPLPHSTILKALTERGHGKASAREAIAWCQKQKEIEHDLMAGYVLAPI